MLKIVQCLGKHRRNYMLFRVVQLIMYVFTYIAYGLTVCPTDKFYFNDNCYVQCTLSAYLQQNNNNNPDNINQLYTATEGSTYCLSSCSNECLTCQKYADFCTQCKQYQPDINNNGIIMFLLQQRGKCFNNLCPQFYYRHTLNKECLSCAKVNKNCNNCTHNDKCTINGGTQNCLQQDEIVCLSCNDGYYSLHDQLGTLNCLNYIPDGYVAIISELVQCQGDCLTCTINEFTCLSCKSSLVLFNQQCISQCPQSHYSNKLTILFNAVQTQTLYCQRCEPPCNACLNSLHCLNCVIDFYMIQQTGLCVGPQECPDNTYPNTTSYKCQPCQQPCTSCFNYNQCKQCVDGFYLFDKQCVEQCPSGTFNHNTTHPNDTNKMISICSQCQWPCKSCLGIEKCLSCSYDKGHLVYFSEQNSCLTQCPIGYKEDSQNRFCEKCPVNCVTCDFNDCLSCSIVNNKLYYLFSSKDNSTNISGTICVQTCPVSYYQVTQVSPLDGNEVKYCKECPQQCRTCENERSCSYCNQGYYFYQQNKSCLNSCPASAPIQKLIPQTNQESFLQYQCMPCSKEYCLECTKFDYCLKCQAELISINQQNITDVTNLHIMLFNGSCVTTCPSNYVKLINTTTNLYECVLIVAPTDNNDTNQTNNSSSTLQQSQADNVILSIAFPFIASITTAVVFVMIVSVFVGVKIVSNKKRLFLPFVSGSIAVVQSLTICYILLYHIMYNLDNISQWLNIKPQTYTLFLSTLFTILIGLINFIVNCKIFTNDQSFLHWKLHHSLCSKILYGFISTLSIVNFKISNIFWSKFSIFPVLSEINKLKPYTVLSGLSLLPLLGFVVSLILLSYQQSEIRQAYYDGMAVLLFSNLLNLLSLKRPEDLFVFQLSQVSNNLQGSQWIEESNLKINLHKRGFQADTYFIRSMKPTRVYEQHSDEKHYRRKFKYEDIRIEQTQINSINSLRSLQSSVLMRSVRGSQDNFQNQRESKIGRMQQQQKKKRQRQRLEKSCSVMVKQNERQYSSFADYGRGGVQTDQSTENQELNRAISDINQDASQQDQLGSVQQSQSQISQKQQVEGNKQVQQIRQGQGLRSCQYQYQDTGPQQHIQKFIDISEIHEQQQQQVQSQIAQIESNCVKKEQEQQESINFVNVNDDEKIKQSDAQKIQASQQQQDVKQQYNSVVNNSSFSHSQQSHTNQDQESIHIKRDVVEQYQNSIHQQQSIDQKQCETQLAQQQMRTKQLKDKEWQQIINISENESKLLNQSKPQKIKNYHGTDDQMIDRVMPFREYVQQTLQFDHQIQQPSNNNQTNTNNHQTNANNLLTNTGNNQINTNNKPSLPVNNNSINDLSPVQFTSSNSHRIQQQGYIQQLSLEIPSSEHQVELSYFNQDIKQNQDQQRQLPLRRKEKKNNLYSGNTKGQRHNEIPDPVGNGNGELLNGSLLKVQAKQQLSCSNNAHQKYSDIQPLSIMKQLQSLSASNGNKSKDKTKEQKASTINTQVLQTNKSKLPQQNLQKLSSRQLNNQIDCSEQSLKDGFKFQIQPQKSTQNYDLKVQLELFTDQEKIHLSNNQALNQKHAQHEKHLQSMLPNHEIQLQSLNENYKQNHNQNQNQDKQYALQNNQTLISNPKSRIKKDLTQKQKYHQQQQQSQQQQQQQIIVIEQILPFEDSQFKQLKSKLRSLEKEKRKQLVISQKIAQQRLLFNINQRKNQQKSIKGSKQKQQLPRPSSLNKLIKANNSRLPNRKNKLYLQSKQHVQKIYRNSSFSQNKSRNKSIQNKKSNKNNSLQNKNSVSQQKHPNRNISK